MLFHHIGAFCPSGPETSYSRIHRKVELVRAKDFRLQNIKAGVIEFWGNGAESVEQRF